MRCRVDGCEEESKYPLCRAHWRADQDERLSNCEECDRLMESDKPLCSSCFRLSSSNSAGSPSSRRSKLTATAIGEEFGSKAHRINRVLNELGWIEQDVEGWIPTELGKKHGATTKEHTQSGVPYVLWPESLLTDTIFKRALAEFDPNIQSPATPAPPQAVATLPSIAAREKFIPEYRAADGHFVRSRAEMLIDNWLYEKRIIHAYEKRVPIEEELLSDFYLPEGKVYIEFWGMENDPTYRERKEKKRALYSKEQVPLIELDDEHLRNLDDHLPRLLLKFKISIKDR